MHRAALCSLHHLQQSLLISLTNPGCDVQSSSHYIHVFRPPTVLRAQRWEWSQFTSSPSRRFSLFQIRYMPPVQVRIVVGSLLMPTLTPGTERHSSRTSISRGVPLRTMYGRSPQTHQRLCATYSAGTNSSFSRPCSRTMRLKITLQTLQPESLL